MEQQRHSQGREEQKRVQPWGKDGRGEGRRDGSRDRHQQRESQERQGWDGMKVVRDYFWRVHGVGERG